MSKISKYIIFAILSTLVNLSFQYFSFYFYNGTYSLYIAMFNGTLSGLILKYLLDKKFIFEYETKNRYEDGKKFILYSLMGVLTTFVFWIFEFIFDTLYDNKYLGAVIGLFLGYVIKYFLDKKFVFRN
jgi:putative flippase GtrA